MLLAILTVLAATDCGIATDSVSGQRQYDCIARELAARRPFVARVDAPWNGNAGPITLGYEGDATGTVRAVTRHNGKIARYVIFSPDGKTPPLRAGGVVTPPVLAKEIRKRTRNPRAISGLVIVETTIDRDGRVAQTHILKALPDGLDKAAEKLVKTLRFEPGRFFGQKTVVIWNVSVHVSGNELIVPATPENQKRRVTSR